MKKMILRLGALFVIVVQLACSNDDDFRGSGNIISEDRTLASFTKINNSTSINVVVSENTSQEVQVSADDNIISQVRTVVEDGVLNIGLVDGNYIDVTITVSIGIPNFEEVENTGSGNISISGFNDLPNLTVVNEGSGNITINGSGSILSITNSGSGNFNGFGFAAADCSVTNSGSGNCEINSSDTLDGTNSGSGTIFYKGGAAVDINNTGSGQIVDSN